MGVDGGPYGMVVKARLAWGPECEASIARRPGGSSVLSTSLWKAVWQACVALWGLHQGG